MACLNALHRGLVVRLVRRGYLDGDHDVGVLGRELAQLAVLGGRERAYTGVDDSVESSGQLGDQCEPDTATGPGDW
jgi:hypothetical protein